MFSTVYEISVTAIFAVLLITFMVQWAWGRWEQVRVWKSLSKVRGLPGSFREADVARVTARTLTVPMGKPLRLPPGAKVTDANGALKVLPGGATITAPQDTTMMWSGDLPVITRNIVWDAETRRRISAPWALPEGKVAAFDWESESEYWAEAAEDIRRSFLARTQATADKWRNVFAALLAVFGAVAIVKPALPAGQPMEGRLYACLIIALLMATQAVAYTGWASAGLPKRLANATASTAFVAQTDHASRSVIRLRVGLFCGGVSAVALILAVATLLSSGMN